MSARASRRPNLNAMRNKRVLIFFLAIIGIAGAAMWIGKRSHATQTKPEAGLIAGGVREATNTPRRIYPLSVVPGGVYSSDELARARRMDSVVTAHYADFGTVATAGRLTQDAYMYVSYRRGDRVFWTLSKHRIPRGEAVLTDGKNLARARCGNRLSDVARQPTLPGPQPTEKALNMPSLPPPLGLPAPPLFSPEYEASLPVAPTGTAASPSVPGPAAATTPAASPLSPLGFASGIGPAGFPYVAAPGTSTVGTKRGGSGGTTPGSGGPGIHAPGSGPSPVPEPASFGLLSISAALGFLLACREISRRRN